MAASNYFPSYRWSQYAAIVDINASAIPMRLSSHCCYNYEAIITLLNRLFALTSSSLLLRCA